MQFTHTIQADGRFLDGGHLCCHGTIESTIQVAHPFVKNISIVNTYRFYPKNRTAEFGPDGVYVEYYDDLPEEVTEPLEEAAYLQFKDWVPSATPLVEHYKNVQCSPLTRG